MLIDEIKQENVTAMKEKNAIARNILGIVMNKYMIQTVEARGTGKEIGDVELVKIIQKTIKELTEEKENYLKVGNTEEAEKIELQKNVIEKYLPKMLSEEEIEQIILGLEDKSVPSVMRHFKTNYNGTCDMKTVSSILNKINK